MWQLTKMSPLMPCHKLCHTRRQRITLRYSSGSYDVLMLLQGRAWSAAGIHQLHHRVPLLPIPRSGGVLARITFHVALRVGLPTRVGHVCLLTSRREGTREALWRPLVGTSTGDWGRNAAYAAGFLKL